MNRPPKGPRPSSKEPRPSSNLKKRTKEEERSNPTEKVGSNPSTEKKPRLKYDIALYLIRENSLGMFGSDIPQILHVTERSYDSLKSPVLTHLTNSIKKLKEIFPSLIVKFWDDDATNALFRMSLKACLIMQKHFDF